MKLCSSCQTINADADTVCKKCGKPLLAKGDSGPTVHWTGEMPLALRPKGGVFQSLTELFTAKDRLVIGRAPDCDICLPHPLVSRYHALLEKQHNALRLRDLASVNGVWVGGRRVTDPVEIVEGERVGIGPFLFVLRDGVIHSIDNSRSLRLEARSLEKEVPIGRGQRRKLLEDVNLVVNPGEFVSLLGPSGSGKSTLMDCLNGRRRATAGKVLANGEDFYRHFDNFRQSLGYVPQKDIVHTQLTVYKALYYTARLRLPTDTEPAELHERIEAVVKEMELGPHRDTLVGLLSGGQIKRVSLGAELLAKPCLLYIDEATSGLDAGTEARMMRLFRRLADEGRSIVCITHNVDHVDQCHLALILARGKLVYYGPPAEALAYFGVGKIGDIYDRLAGKEPTDWQKQFVKSSLYEEFITRRLLAPLTSLRTSASDGTPVPSPTAHAAETTPAPVVVNEPTPVVPRQSPAAPQEQRATEPRPDTTLFGPALAERFRALTARALQLRELLVPLRDGWNQFRVLTARYTELMLGDRRSLRLLLLQAPIVAVFLLLGFLDKKFQDTMPNLRDLTDKERTMLQAVDAVSGLIDQDRPPTPEQLQALQHVKVEVAIAGRTVTLNGQQLLDILRRARRLSGNASNRQVLEKARLTFTDDAGRPHTLTMLEFTDIFQQLHKSGVVKQLIDFPNPVVPAGEIINPRYTYILLFVLVMVVLWFGCNNAAKEIVKEEAIYGRERAVNLGIVPYLASKFLVLSVITMFHAVLLMAVLYGTFTLFHWINPARYSVPVGPHMLPYGQQLGILSLLAMTGVALGLLLSACVSSPDRANALLPYVLIPQMILGGGFLSVDTGVLHYLAVLLSPVYWAYRAVHRGADNLPDMYPGKVNYPDSLWAPSAALVIQMAVLLLLTAVFLRKKDV